MSTIPQLSELRRRLNNLQIKKASYGISADPHIEIEIEDLSAVVGLMERIDIKRQRLNVLIQQNDHFGNSTPPHVVNEIMQERASIVQLRQQCARKGQNVAAHPLDDEMEVELPPISTPARLPISGIRSKLDQIEQLLNEIRQELN